jgi:hypothetical protein
MFESVCIPRQRYLFVTGLLAQLRLCYRAARAAPLALLGRLRRNRSGAAQAARCLTYPVQFHLNVQPISPHDVVVLGLHTDWGYSTVLALGLRDYPAINRLGGSTSRPAIFAGSGYCGL